jgi:hypothetical protein
MNRHGQSLPPSSSGKTVTERNKMSSNRPLGLKRILHDGRIRCKSELIRPPFRLSPDAASPCVQCACRNVRRCRDCGNCVIAVVGSQKQSKSGFDHVCKLMVVSVGRPIDDTREGVHEGRRTGLAKRTVSSPATTGCQPAFPNGW